MATVTTALTAGKRPSLATMDRKVYAVDGWRRMKVWDGYAAATRSGGIAGPAVADGSWDPSLSTTFATGIGTLGVHLIRYRYMSSKTGYVSEPSPAYTWSMAASTRKGTFKIAGAGSSAGPHATGLAFTAQTITRDSGDWTADGFAVGDYVTFANAENAANNATFGPITALSATVMTIGSGGLTTNTDDTTATWSRALNGRITPSTDSEVDRIVIEMTLAGGTTFRKAAEALNSASSVVVNVSDGTLEQEVLPWPDDEEGLAIHLLPPVGANVLAYRNRLWIYGQVVHSTGTVDVTNGSASVAGTGTDWTADALTPTASGLQRTKRFLRVGTDARYYEISAQTSATGLTLAEVYAGSTAAGAVYTIFSLDNNVYYSEPGLPESWPLTGFFKGPAEGRTRALAGVLNGLVIYSLSSTDYLRFTEDPATDGTKRQVSNERGAVNSRVVVTANERAYALDRHGVHVFEGVEAKPLSRPIQSVILQINWTVEETFHACYYPALRAIRWWVALDADTLPKHYLQYDLEADMWSTGQREIAVTASRQVPTTEGVRVLVGDENGQTWFDDEGETDGADGTPSVRATGTPTTTVVDVEETLVADELVGTTLHHEELGETRVISANTTSQVTVSVAFSRAPVAGERFQVGRILARLRSRAVSPGGFMRRHTALHAHVAFVPTDEQRFLRARVFRNYSTDAATWGEDARGDQDALKGVTPPEGATDTDWLIDTSRENNPEGVARFPVGGEDSCHVTEVELEVLDSDHRVKILGLALNAVPIEAVT